MRLRLLGDQPGKFDARANTQLVEDVSEVCVNRVRGEKQPLPRLPIRHPASDEVGDAALAVRETSPAECRSVGAGPVLLDSSVRPGCTKPHQRANQHTAIVHRFAIRNDGMLGEDDVL